MMDDDSQILGDWNILLVKSPFFIHPFSKLVVAFRYQAGLVQGWTQQSGEQKSFRNFMPGKPVGFLASEPPKKNNGFLGFPIESWWFNRDPYNGLLFNPTDNWLVESSKS